MKSIIFKSLLVVVLMAGLCACNNNGNNNPPEQPKTVDYDKMIGFWNLDSFAEKWVNTDENIVERDTTITKGSITIKKEKDEDGDMQYYYTENFLTMDGEEYEGRFFFSGGFAYLYAQDGFNRKDQASTYDFTVTFPAENKMEWTYNWKGTHADYTMSHQDHRTVTAKFTKKQ